MVAAAAWRTPAWAADSADFRMLAVGWPSSRPGGGRRLGVALPVQLRSGVHPGDRSRPEAAV